MHTLPNWKEEIPSAVYELGGCKCRVYEEKSSVNIYTDLGSTKRKILLDWCKEHKPTGMSVTIRHSSQDTNNTVNEKILTDAELYEVLGALPDDCSNGVDLDGVDVQKLRPYIKKYGGLPELLDAIGKTVDTTEDATEQSKSSWSCGNDTLLPEAETPQQSIERVCNEYVSGEIETVLELEEELEAPVTEQLEAEGLLV